MIYVPIGPHLKLPPRLAWSDQGRPAKARVLSLKLLQKGSLFAQNRHERPAFRSKTGCFPGFVFTDKYTIAVDQDVYFVSLVLMTSPQWWGLG